MRAWQNIMALAPAQPEANVLNAALTVDQQRISTQLYYMFALSIDADAAALSIVERAGIGEGMLAWWRLVQMFEPDVARRLTELLQEVFSHRFTGDAR